MRAHELDNVRSHKRPCGITGQKFDVTARSSELGVRSKIINDLSVVLRVDLLRLVGVDGEMGENGHIKLIIVTLIPLHKCREDDEARRVVETARGNDVVFADAEFGMRSDIAETNKEVDPGDRADSRKTVKDSLVVDEKTRVVVEGVTDTVPRSMSQDDDLVAVVDGGQTDKFSHCTSSLCSDLVGSGQSLSLCLGNSRGIGDDCGPYGSGDGREAIERGVRLASGFDDSVHDSSARTDLFIVFTHNNGTDGCTSELIGRAALERDLH